MQVAVLSAVELKNIGVKGQQHSTAMFLYLSLKGKTYIYICFSNHGSNVQIMNREMDIQQQYYYQ
jgi:hypothetical protein